MLLTSLIRYQPSRVLCNARHCRSVWCYAVPGTDVAYDAMGRRVLKAGMGAAHGGAAPVCDPLALGARR
eukprot:2308249-Rhodomonas_salina.1